MKPIHSPQCVTIGSGPGHNRCICFCHRTLGTTVTVTKDQLLDALMVHDSIEITGWAWSDAIFDDLLTATGHDYAAAEESSDDTD